MMGLIFLAAIGLAIVYAATSREESAPPCKPEDCEDCPFPLCDERRRERNTEYTGLDPEWSDAAKRLYISLMEGPEGNDKQED